MPKRRMLYYSCLVLLFTVIIAAYLKQNQLLNKDKELSEPYHMISIEESKQENENKGNVEQQNVPLKITNYKVETVEIVVLNNEELKEFYTDIGSFSNKGSLFKIWLPTRGMPQDGDPTCWETYPVISYRDNMTELKQYKIYYCPWADDSVLREPIKFTAEGTPIFQISNRLPQKLVKITGESPEEIDVGLNQIWDFKPHPHKNLVAVYGSDNEGRLHIILVDIDNKTIKQIFNYKDETEKASEDVQAHVDFDSDGNLYFDTYYAKEKDIYIFDGQKTEMIFKGAYLPRISPNGNYLAYRKIKDNEDFLDIWDIKKKQLIGSIWIFGAPLWESNSKKINIEFSNKKEIIKVTLIENDLHVEEIKVDGTPFVMEKGDSVEYYVVNQNSIVNEPIIKKVK